MIKLRKVRADERELFWNINQKYLYEMTSYYPDEMDENGNYHYGYFDAYFVEKERIAMFILSDERIVGFAMLNPYSYTDHEVDKVIAEFTIFPSFRRNGFALEAAGLILSAYPGRWEIKYNEKNSAAKALWNKVAAPFCPTVYRLNEFETVLKFTNH